MGKTPTSSPAPLAANENRKKKSPPPSTGTRSKELQQPSSKKQKQMGSVHQSNAGGGGTAGTTVGGGSEAPAPAAAGGNALVAALVEALSGEPNEELDKVLADRFGSRFVAKPEFEFVAKPEFEKLANRVSAMASALEPATIHAMYECAIYYFVAEYLNGIPYYTKHNDADKLIGQIQHSMTTICTGVMEKLRLDQAGVKTEIQWYGKSSSVLGSDKRPLLLRALQGLLAYIELIDEETLWNFDPLARNQFAHDGKHIESVYPPSPLPPPQQPAGTSDYNAKKKKFTSLQARFQALAKEAKDQEVYTIDKQGISKAVRDIVNKLKEKKIHVVELVPDSTGDNITDNIAEVIDRLEAAVSN